MLAALKRWASRIVRDVTALWLAARDRRTPLGAKLMAALTAAYALSPVDLIPDFIPVLGYVDDLILVPLGVWLAVRLIPSELMDELRERADRIEPPRSRLGLLLVAVVWMTLALAVALWVLRPTGV